MIYFELIKKINVKDNVDLYIREVKEDKFSYKLIFFSSLVDEYMVMGLQRSLRLSESINDIYSKLDNIKISTSSNLDEVILLLHEGQVVLYVNNAEYFILVDLRKVPSRGISEPEVEKSLRGSKDGFNESLIVNISLLRTRIKSDDLIIEALRVGSYSKTSICICYISSKVDTIKLKLLKRKLKEINVESLIMSDRSLEEKLFNQNKTIFPLVRYSERPDVSSLYLMEGHIVLLVDTSSNAIIVPISIFDHMKNVEEYRQNYILGNLTKMLRYLGILLSLFFLPISYLLATTSSLNNLYNLNIENTSSLPLWSQISIGLFVIELFRIAIIHTPNTLMSALSIVIGIILGEVSMSLGIFVKDVLIILSIFTISSFSIPSYELSLSNRVISICLFIVSVLFGKVGFLIGIIILFIHLVSIKVMGYPYLYPFIPLDIKKLKIKFFRKDVKKNKKV
ncbi:MAG: spore germination protein [Erysipelotrichaceae bacterium]|nr:spore germination protein [Erysipelotrichaceae bacterium]